MAASSSECRRTGRHVVRNAVVAQSSTVTAGYLSSDATVASGGIGTSDCPFSLRAAPGQRIRLSLAAFAGQSRSSSEDDEELGDDSKTPRPGLCYEVGTVTDSGGSRQPGKSQPLTACGLPSDRSPSSPSVLYQSESNNITVQLYPIPVLLRLAPFIIKYEGTQTSHYFLYLQQATLGCC